MLAKNIEVFNQCNGKLRKLSVPDLDISEVAQKIYRSLKATGTPPLKFPGILQRNAEASRMVPLHGVLPNECLNCYESHFKSERAHQSVIDAFC